MKTKSSTNPVILILLAVSTSAVTDFKGYEGCLETKGCFGYPKDCVESTDCKVLVTYLRVPGENQFDFEISHINGVSSGGEYAAMAFSDDNSMGRDLVFACVGGQSLFVGWNSVKSRPTALPDPATALAKDQTFVADDGVNTCKFRLDAQLNFTVNGASNEQRSIDLSGGGKHLLVATGRGRADRLEYHDATKIASASPISFDSFSAVETSGDALLRAHAVLMILAWMAFVPVAMMMPRYFKGRWDHQLCGNGDAPQTWFVVHVVMVVTGVLLSIIGVALVIGEKGTDPLKADLSENPHPVIGIIALLFMYAQIPMAAIRPSPHHRSRSVFNWAHWSVGNLALLFAVVAIFLGGSLNALPIIPTEDYVFIVAAFCVVHALAHFALMVNRHKERIAERAKINPQQPENDNVMQLEVEETGGPRVDGRFRWVVFVLYAGAAFSFAIALSALIGSAANGRQCWGECGDS